jgi:sugar/nucleoside kinase (ribokinase family)
MTTGDDSRGVLAAAALRAARDGGRLPRCLVGFDGFIDSIYDVVDRRRDMTPDGYERITAIPALAARIAAASGRSANIELVRREERFGGNGPLMAAALAALGCPTTFVGAVGRDEDWRTLHPAYEPLAAACERVVPIAPTGRTDALEFHDGKVMFNHAAGVQAVTWERLVEVVGLESLVEIVRPADLIGITNWTILGGVEGIWEGLVRDVLPRVEAARKRVFIDLSDPAKRSDDDVRRALGVLQTMNALVPVTLGLNLSEAERVARVLGARLAAAADPLAYSEALASAVRTAAALSCVVVHRPQGAAAATEPESARFETEVTDTPVISTGAGDHFNAGFACAEAAGLSLPHCLAVGCGVSGAHVRGTRVSAWMP